MTDLPLATAMRIVELFRGAPGRRRLDTVEIAEKLELPEPVVANELLRWREDRAARREEYGACKRSSLEAGCDPGRTAEFIGDLRVERRIGGARP